MMDPEPTVCWQCHGDLDGAGILVFDSRDDLEHPRRRFCSWACVREFAIRRIRSGLE